MAAAADFPTPHNSEKGNPAPTTPEQALQGLHLPAGFAATMWAHEPEVQNPIGMAWDARGRMFVAENYTYAERPVRFAEDLRDRIVILEDKDHDGVAETRRVFTDQLPGTLTSVEVSRGGVWALCPPQLLFIPDANGDDVPDGPPRVVLDGFTVAKENYHNFANGLRWGPDGWLYGRCGASCPGEPGLPGTPLETRPPLRGTMWRFHPERKVVEVLSQGTTNPWGHDWDQHGELFFTNTVNGHLWHGITGAHFVRPHTFDPNPYAYVALDMIADHWHFDTGKGWQASRDGKANDLGGGHAHCGAMIYQGDRWPAEYRNQLFTMNFHGRRANVELLERAGSSYVAHHGKDAFLWDDPWFRPVDIQQGPDGAAYVLDWSDTGECHDSTGVHRTSGRIYRIDYKEAPPLSPVDVSTLKESQLIEMLSSADVWRVRKAQDALVSLEMSEANDIPARLQLLFKTASSDVVKLRAMLTLFRLNLADDAWLTARLGDPSEHIRAWAIRLLVDRQPLDFVDGRIQAKESLRVDLAPLGKDTSGLVRLTLASALQRLEPRQRGMAASALTSQADAAADHTLNALVWYALMPLAEKNGADLATATERCEWPELIRWTARRLASDSEKRPDRLAAFIQTAHDQFAVLQGMSDGFQGWRKAPPPKGWELFAKKVSPQLDDAGLALVRDLSTLFGDGRALDDVKRIALDTKADINIRAAALKTLIDSRPDDLRDICQKLLEVKFLNLTAARGLATFDDPAIGTLLADNFRKFHPSDRPAVIEVLVTRAPWAVALLEAMRKGGLQRNEISAFHARQMRNLGDAALTQKLTAMWGELRDSSADNKAAIEKLRATLTPELLAKADASRGRQFFTQTCAVCHTLYGEGGKIGPDLTGANRQNLDYLLENIVDPSAVVTADFRVTLLTMKDGRVLSGMTSAGTAKTLTVRTLTETTALDRDDIAKTEVLAASMMPEGLLQALAPEQVRDLFAYLMGTEQAPLPGQ